MFTFLPKDFDFNNAQVQKTPLSPEILIKGDVCGYCNGLFLCCSNRYTTGHGYFVYDPFTKECTHIPSFPEADQNESLYAVGFISHTENSTRRFWVIVINFFIIRKHEFEVKVFYSERGVWEEMLSWCTNCFAFAPHWTLGLARGTDLYFMGRTNIFMFDSIFSHYYIMDYPEGADAMNIINFGYLGGSGRALKMADISHNELRVWRLIRVWEAEGDHTTGINLYQTWDLVHRIDLYAHFPEKIRGEGYKRVAGFHPYDEDIVYIYSYVDGFFVGNMRTNKFEYVSGYDHFDISPFQLELPVSSPIPFTIYKLPPQIDCLVI